MLRISHILWTTDFSPASQLALPYATELTRRFDARLHLFHVVADPVYQPLFIGSYGIDFEKLLRDRLLAAKEQLDRIAEKTGMNPETACRVGRPADQILGYAREANIDLIVMSSHGHSGLTHFLVGGVTERVVHYARCPVLTIKAQPKGSAGREVEASTETVPANERVRDVRPL